MALQPREWLFPGECLAGQSFVRLDIFGSRLCHDILGQSWRRARLVPAGGLEPVADELLVERRLRTAGPIRIDRPVPRAVGREHLVNQQQLAGFGVKPPFKLRVGQDQTTAEAWSAAIR